MGSFGTTRIAAGPAWESSWGTPSHVSKHANLRKQVYEISSFSLLIQFYKHFCGVFFISWNVCDFRGASLVTSQSIRSDSLESTHYVQEHSSRPPNMPPQYGLRLVGWLLRPSSKRLLLLCRQLPHSLLFLWSNFRSVSHPVKISLVGKRQ